MTDLLTWGKCFPMWITIIQIQTCQAPLISLLELVMVTMASKWFWVTGVLFWLGDSSRSAFIFIYANVNCKPYPRCSAFLVLFLPFYPFNRARLSPGASAPHAGSGSEGQGDQHGELAESPLPPSLRQELRTPCLRLMTKVSTIVLQKSKCKLHMRAKMFAYTT